MSTCPTVEDTVRDAEAAALRYFELTNTAIGLLSFNAGLSCISTESPRMYAFITAVFALIVWDQGRRSLDRRLRMLRNIGHPIASNLYLWRRSLVALMGWAFLGLIAIGTFTTKGISF